MQGITSNILFTLVWQYSHTNFIISVNCANSKVPCENDEHLTQMTAQIIYTLSGNKAKWPSYCIIIWKGEVKRGRSYLSILSTKQEMQQSIAVQRHKVT
jgi:hypothetical protein